VAARLEGVAHLIGIEPDLGGESDEVVDAADVAPSVK
jgi:hypothetical protein